MWDVHNVLKNQIILVNYLRIWVCWSRHNLKCQAGHKKCLNKPKISLKCHTHTAIMKVPFFVKELFFCINPGYGKRQGLHMNFYNDQWQKKLSISKITKLKGFFKIIQWFLGYI